MKISSDFCGGNIEVLKISNDAVYFDNQLRDTKGGWFYWAFCIEGAQGKTVKFDFIDKNYIGYYGPAVSYDLKNWHWLGKRDSKSCFTYSFKSNESKVYFAHNMLYHPDRFIEFAKDNNFEVLNFCNSKKGRSIPYITFGKGSKNILLTARHHACESTGNYIMEGVLKGFKASLPDDYRVICLPFVDYDGVIDGDQGKNRKPHDHNRDYIDEPLYETSRKIIEIARKEGIFIGLDFHSPWHTGGLNDKIYIVQKSKEHRDRLIKLGEIFESCITPDALKYHTSDDLAPDTEWNIADTPTVDSYLWKNGAYLALSLETAYFGEEDNIFDDKKAVKTGECFAKAIISLIKTNSTL